MRDHGVWSLSFGRWFGVQIRLHIFFCLFAAFTLFLGWSYDRSTEGGGESLPMIGVAAIALAILLASVLWHEVVHLWAARQLGGNHDLIVLGPLGGLSPLTPPFFPQMEVLAHLAGPLANLVICLICLPALLMSMPWQDVLSLLNPLGSAALFTDDSFPGIALNLTFWINWLLLIVNLIPAFPFDGGRALRAGLANLWRAGGRRHAARVVARVAQVAAIGLLVAAWFVASHSTAEAEGLSPVPVWFLLVMLAIFLFFSSLNEKARDPAPELDDGFYGYEDFADSGHFDHDEDLDYSGHHSTVRQGPIARWFEERRAARIRREKQREVEDERRVDEILDRVHKHGMESLSREERELLERVANRYRNRQT